MRGEGDSERYFADIGVRPCGNLFETASVLGRVLLIEFFEDKSGRFEEFPCFIAEGQGLTYALLGVPDLEYDLRDGRVTDFELVVRSNNWSLHSKSKVDISEGIVFKVNSVIGKVCWVLS
ncbi:hypothetical protein NUH87_30190 [Pseudomonas batumici]|uniref:hypothetical protein n=1 Tax=Pseudomonas batumici TaxID=226910 RepID=UPI0030D03619